MATSQIPQGAAIIGAAVPRIDGPLKTTGTARYSLDHHFPDLAHAVALQSTIGKSRIRSLDVSGAEKMPGVLAVLRHGNLQNVYRTFPHQQEGRAAATARQLNRPVKLSVDRRMMFSNVGHRVRELPVRIEDLLKSTVAEA